MYKKVLYLPAKLGDRGRDVDTRVGLRIEANLDVAREEILEGERARLAVHAERGDSAGGLRDNQLHLAERAAGGDVRAANVLEEASARGVDGGQVAGAEVGPRGRGERLGTRRGVQRVDEAREVTNGDVELIIH